MGVAIFCVCVLIVDTLTPYDPWGEIAEKRNPALATVVPVIGTAVGPTVCASVHG